jgi:hypothetical protein
MSDDADEYPEYEDGDGGDGAADGAEPEADAEGDADEYGLDEDAAGSDDEELGDDAGDEEDPGLLETGDARRAAPQRLQVDPILRASNTPRRVVVIPAAERRTDNRLHKTEAAQVVALRATQIDKTGTCFAAAPTSDPVARAMAELLARQCPLILQRAVGTGPGGELYVEEWRVNEMSLPPLDMPTALGSGGL